MKAKWEIAEGNREKEREVDKSKKVLKEFEGVAKERKKSGKKREGEKGKVGESQAQRNALIPMVVVSSRAILTGLVGIPAWSKYKKKSHEQKQKEKEM